MNKGSYKHINNISKVNEISRRNFINNDDLDDDEDDNNTNRYNNKNNEIYLIDPAIETFKSIDFNNKNNSMKISSGSSKIISNAGKLDRQLSKSFNVDINSDSNDKTNDVNYSLDELPVTVLQQSKSLSIHINRLDSHTSMKLPPSSSDNNSSSSLDWIPDINSSKLNNTNNHYKLNKIDEESNKSNKIFTNNPMLEELSSSNQLNYISIDISNEYNDIIYNIQQENKLSNQLKDLHLLIIALDNKSNQIIDNETELNKINQQKHNYINGCITIESDLNQIKSQLNEQLSNERTLLEKNIVDITETLNRMKQNNSINKSKLNELNNSLTNKQNKLKFISEQISYRNEFNNKTINKHELKKIIEKMKFEIQKISLSTNDLKSNEMKLTNTNSLFAMLDKPNKQLDKQAMISHTINAIPEEDNTDDDKQSAASCDEDLPAPHAAAAVGDLERLQMFFKLEPTLLSSFDSIHRSPLFYAVANGSYEDTKYLLEIYPNMIYERDIHGDTPIHAAVSTGHANCLLELINEAKKYYHNISSTTNTDKSKYSVKNLVNLPNNMLMTPIHLTLNVQCLEILYENDAELNIVDKDNRTPLFIYCALNRSECAEYIVSCLDQDNTSLLLPDSRGDTPLHAAACNGSIDCLLLLLQYGIDPTTHNAVGLKPIELAIRNKQKECERLLLQYQLHYFTHSNFDSVLFLAALEGHKKVKTEMKSSDNFQYNIIRSSNHNNNTNSGSSAINSPKSPSLSNSFHAHSATNKSLHNIKSLFSLKSSKTMHMQRWGSWICYVDHNNNNKTYWYNHERKIGQWDIPTDVLILQQQIESNASDKQGHFNPKMSMRLKRIGDWIQYATETGQSFYYNDKTGNFQWNHPNDSIDESHSPLFPKDSEPIDNSNPVSPTDKNKNVDLDSNEIVDKPNNNFGDWQPYMDPKTGFIFWYNHSTHVSQWDCPNEIKDKVDNSTMNHIYNDDLVNVVHVDDLGI